MPLWRIRLEFLFQTSRNRAPGHWNTSGDIYSWMFVVVLMWTDNFGICCRNAMIDSTFGLEVSFSIVFAIVFVAWFLTPLY